MGILWRKSSKIEEMILSYFDTCDQCFEMFAKAFHVYFEQGLSAGFEEAVYACHAAESKADDKRREVEQTLYGKALLPDSRGDLLGLLEVYDKIPNTAETVLFAILCQRVKLPEDLAPSFKKLVELNLEAYAAVRKAVDTLFAKPKETRAATYAVDCAESGSDKVERELITSLFAGDYPLETKLLVKEAIILIGDISDRAETCADRIDIVAIKRQI